MEVDNNEARLSYLGFEHIYLLVDNTENEKCYPNFNREFPNIFLKISETKTENSNLKTRING